MNTLFIILLVLGCGFAVATFMCFASAMYYRKYKDNGAYRLRMGKYIWATIIMLVLTIGVAIGTICAATRCPSCDEIVMHEYCTHCGTHVEENDKRCDSCNAEIYGDTYCGHCGAKQEEE